MKINIHNCEEIISDIDMKKNFKNFRSCEATDDRVESTLKISIAHIMWEFVIKSWVTKPVCDETISARTENSTKNQDGVLHGTPPLFTTNLYITKPPALRPL